MRGAAADLECALDEVARLENALRINLADDRVDRVFLETFELRELLDADEPAIDEERVKALALGPARHFGVEPFARFDERREHLERAAAGGRFELPNDGGERLLFHRQIAIRTKLRPGFGEEEPEKMVNFRDRGDGRFAAAARH